MYLNLLNMHLESYLGITLNRVGDKIEDLIDILIGLNYKLFSIPDKREFSSKSEIIKVYRIH